MRSITLSLCSLLALPLCACAPPNVTGMYTGAVTNRDNGCMLSNFNPGDSNSGITMDVTQAGSSVSASVNGLAGVALALFTGNGDPLLGTTTLSGFNVSKVGRTPMNDGDCTFNTLVEASATLSGDSLSGTVVYRYQVTNASACGYRASCRTEQSFAFVRPPR